MKELGETSADNSVPAEVVVIALVGNIYGATEMALYVNPYNMISLEPQSGYSATFHSDAKPIVLSASSDISTDGPTNIYLQKMNPLIHIRLIELFPNEYDEPLKGALHVVPIANPGKFWALSCVWGGLPSEFAPYYFETKEGRILITSSLALALRQIRKRMGANSTRIWADAICIVQSDSYEKAGQIPLMGEIYKMAERVFAWLGPEDDTTTQAMTFLARVSVPNDTLDEATSSQSLPISSDTMLMEEDVLSALNYILSSSWFTRVWIVQELILGSHVFLVYGNTEMEWEQFISAIRFCEDQLRKMRRYQVLIRSFYPALALGKVRSLRHQTHRQYTLLELLEYFAYTQATKEEDKLFALRGLALEHSDKAFTPQYGPSPESAIRQYAAGFIKSHKVMQLLYRAGSAKSYPFCSWIPSWTRGPYPQTISG